ncbi:hypothetical protein EYF80_036163 [Liparis tanakae]|uniref:Uncharacterized protein n=1 Tax=Liparis tanakae TaxID=230148 RepID=A0A4Z2GJY1_9TELE|nr:hypothetical protein EYF80_036163 [Liparis tanakae]
MTDERSSENGRVVFNSQRQGERQAEADRHRASAPPGLEHAPHIKARAAPGRPSRLEIAVTKPSGPRLGQHPEGKHLSAAVCRAARGDETVNPPGDAEPGPGGTPINSSPCRACDTRSRLNDSLHHMFLQKMDSGPVGRRWTLGAAPLRLGERGGLCASCGDYVHVFSEVSDETVLPN